MEKICETEFYLSADEFLEDVNASIPESLQFLLNNIILKNKRGSLESYNIKCTSICHAIMSAVRPRSFLSPLQIGVAVMLHRKFASKKIIDILNNLGVCCSYAEACQYVFDNADFNTNTLDAANTFHSMGGIRIITPANCLEKRERVQRRKCRVKASELSEIGKIPFHIFDNSDGKNYEQLVVRDISTPDVDTDIICNADFMWLLGKFTLPEKIPGWNGFMGKLTEQLSFNLSRICPLPFVNSPPSDANTIFTVLKHAATLSLSLNIHKVFVTFDLPLYQKAVQIIYSCPNDNSLKTIMPCLGGFHLLMSYLGAIGFIMAGSGLNEIFSLCYAKTLWIKCYQVTLMQEPYEHTLSCIWLYVIKLSQKLICLKQIKNS
ncbi:hypothetical protein ALC57_16838 [Trachymyrmex cornetzi]|uniref:Uncharacterized protein n=1 Tax=Trachymyrmex cornetzi TaxID=471704 RepID=A0A151IUD0_9HYME|nr:hypothetical protein ALC57_16838 [Trachymyrmex cornetzi]